eukprot:NODE_574_length_5874_cov_0.812294.p3 type:complete len:309 gc:universal NODE_574_length_5874_cov_0.812294:3377-4303(+)
MVTQAMHFENIHGLTYGITFIFSLFGLFINLAAYYMFDCSHIQMILFLGNLEMIIISILGGMYIELPGSIITIVILTLFVIYVSGIACYPVIRYYRLLTNFKKKLIIFYPIMFISFYFRGLIYLEFISMNQSSLASFYLVAISAPIPIIMNFYCMYKIGHAFDKSTIKWTDKHTRLLFVSNYLVLFAGTLQLLSFAFCLAGYLNILLIVFLSFIGLVFDTSEFLLLSNKYSMPSTVIIESDPISNLSNIPEMAQLSITHPLTSVYFSSSNRLTPHSHRSMTTDSQWSQSILSNQNSQIVTRPVTPKLT